jgi:hypothetical protein
MENFPIFLVTFNVCAATFPRFASATGLVWVIGRVMYQLKYQKVGPKGRRHGSLLSGIGALILVISCRSIVLMAAWWWNLRYRNRVHEAHVTQMQYGKDLVSKCILRKVEQEKWGLDSILTPDISS